MYNIYRAAAGGLRPWPGGAPPAPAIQAGGPRKAQIEKYSMNVVEYNYIMKIIRSLNKKFK